MSEWFKLLPLELSEIPETELAEPRHPMQQNDRQVGDMSLLAKKLFTLAMLLDKSGSQNKLDAQYCNDKTERERLMARASEYSSKAEALRTLMWIGIKDEFGLWNDSIGVRVGFRIVISPQNENDLPPFLKNMFRIE